MKAPRVTPGTGTLGRFAKPRPIVTLSLQDNGYGAGSSFGGEAVTNWSCMTAREARLLAIQLNRVADRAERRHGR